MEQTLSVAHVLNEKFSSDGLVALGGDDGVEMALALSLAEQIDEGSATRAWQNFETVDAASGRDMAVEDFVTERADL
jgi:hypothetical protein